MRERAHYLSWLAAAVATTALLGLTFDLLVVQCTGGTVEIDLVALVYGCALLSPSVYVWRKHGEAFHRFNDLEAALDGAIFCRHEPTPLFEEILELIGRIERTAGMERQVVRNEARQWLLRHAAGLNAHEREYVAEQLGYLHRK